jgi:hypothetical protein
VGLVHGILLTALWEECLHGTLYLTGGSARHWRALRFANTCASNNFAGLWCSVTVDLTEIHQHSLDHNDPETVSS